MMAGREAIRLRMDGVPQDLSEAAALLIHCALDFCAKPETFPVFQSWVTTEHADHDWIVTVMSTLEPAIVTEMAAMVAAGVVADFEEAQVTP